MKKPKRTYSRTSGGFYLKRWSEKAAMKATQHRFAQIQGLLFEIGAMWGDEDEYIVTRADELRDEIEQAAREIVEGHNELVEQRRIDARTTP